MVVPVLQGRFREQLATLYRGPKDCQVSRFVHENLVLFGQSPALQIKSTHHLMILSSAPVTSVNMRDSQALNDSDHHEGWVEGFSLGFSSVSTSSFAFAIDHRVGCIRGDFRSLCDLLDESQVRRVTLPAAINTILKDARAEVAFHAFAGST